MAIAFYFHGGLWVFWVVVGFYLLDTLLFSDHIYYNPKSNYRFNLSDSIKTSARIDAGRLLVQLPQTEAAQPLDDRQFDTCLLAIAVEVNVLGQVFDPYIELRSGTVYSRQYFERGAAGLRYINLSRFSQLLQTQSAPLSISARFCKFKTTETELIWFANKNYLAKRALIISPHADDAELAAFGFYKNSAATFIATITAGETEADTYKHLANGDINLASQLVGKLRAWDSLAIPLMAGPQIEAVNLGYFGSSLKSMFNQPDMAIPSDFHGLQDTRVFRKLNKKSLPNDAKGANSWAALVEDLSVIIHDFQPEVIVTPHPQIDPHPDHLYSTWAAVQACAQLHQAPDFLCYANHYVHTDMYPFGPEHADLPLPPNFSSALLGERIYSLPVTDADQLDKVFALQMMHDLNRPVALKKRLRRSLQRFIGRSKMPYGQDEYLRKAIRQQEVFFVSSFAGIKKLLQANKQ